MDLDGPSGSHGPRHGAGGEGVHEDGAEGVGQLGSHVVQEWKSLLASLLEDKLDKFEVLAVARKLSLKLPEKRSFSQQKYILLQLLLLQLIKSDQGRTSYYKRLLTETEQNLDAKKGNPYLCCLVGCLFSTEKHRIYLQHLKAVNFRHDQLICNFRKQCVRQFSSLGRLLSHVKESHSVMADLEKEKRQVEDDVEC